MIRLETESGWRLVSHPEHARLAGRIAEVWGNEVFREPMPRAEVLAAVFRHDDGWKVRDSHPVLSRAGKPSAFSRELVGKYSAFEEIEMQDYLAVRGRALEIIAEEDPYAGVLVSMHTHNLLSERADRSTIRKQDLPMLDGFLSDQLRLQKELKAKLIGKYPAAIASELAFLHNFRFLQACDNASLLGCVRFEGSTVLVQPALLIDGSEVSISVKYFGDDTWELDPYPLKQGAATFSFSCREIPQKEFESTLEFQSLFQKAPEVTASIRLVAKGVL